MAEESIVGGIQLWIFGKPKIEDPDGFSVVFVCHGRMGTAQTTFEICERISQKKALISIAFDQRNHGTRVVDKAKNGGWESPTHVIDMYSTQLGTTHDISYLIDLLPAVLGKRPLSYGVVGVSLGGHVTLLSMANEKRVNFGVSIIGCGDYLALMDNRASSNTQGELNITKDPTLEGRLNPELRKLIISVDPVHRYGEFLDKPLLFLGGEIDKLVPPVCNTEFNRRLQSIYQHPERLKTIIYPQTGHQVIPQMVTDAANWCEEWCHVGIIRVTL